jgi:hypothetical protein
MIELDTGTIEEIAAFLVSNDGPRYLSGPKLREFLQRAGIEEIPDSGDVTNAQLAVLRLADPREYGADRTAYEETLRELREILLPEGLQIIHDERGRPSIVTLTSQEGGQGLRGIELKVSLGQVIQDPALAAVAQERLNEADRCSTADAYMACIIMLGSLLEGVLLAAVQERPHGPLPKALQKMGLQDLINLAHEERWIQFDAQLGSELVRQYRNLVHPRLQLATGHFPDADTLDMCRSVVNAIFNDLAAAETDLSS